MLIPGNCIAHPCNYTEFTGAYTRPHMPVSIDLANGDGRLTTPMATKAVAKLLW